MSYQGKRGAKLAKHKAPIGEKALRSVLLLFILPLKQNTRCVGNSPVAVVIGDTGIPTDLGHKKAIAFHTGNCLVRKTAWFRVIALPAHPAAACAQTQRIRMHFPDCFCESIKVFSVPLLCLAVTP